MSSLAVGTPARIAFDRELAGFICKPRLTPTALAKWAIAHPDLADQLDAILQWFANRSELSGPALAAFHPAMRALLTRLIVAVLTADPRSERP